MAVDEKFGEFYQYLRLTQNSSIVFSITGAIL